MSVGFAPSEEFSGAAAVHHVGAVVVTYNADPSHLAELIDRLVAQVRRVVVVDNASHRVPDFSLHSTSAQIEVISSGANIGIAAAHNIGLRRLRELGCTYGLLMDHDSLPLPEMVGRLLDADLALRAGGAPVAAVGPATIDRRTGVRSKFVKMRHGVVSRVECAAGQRFVEADFLISSGTLLRLDTFDLIGGMNEPYFIDHVDTEWCLRARNAGYRIFGVCDALLDHSLGDRVVRMWFGRMREVPVHSPFRNYYMFRNTVLMLRTVPMPFAWKCAHLFRLVQFLVFFVLGVGPRRERARMMFKGLWHGLIGRMGGL